MKPFIRAGISLLLAPSAFAQELVIVPEVTTQFRAYVTQQQIQPIIIDQPLAIGTVLPGTVTLAPVPNVIIQQDPVYRGYEYAYVGNQIVLVEPATRRIVTVVP